MNDKKIDLHRTTEENRKDEKNGVVHKLSERSFSGYNPCNHSILHSGSFNTPAQLIIAKSNKYNLNFLNGGKNLIGRCS